MSAKKQSKKKTKHIWWIQIKNALKEIKPVNFLLLAAAGTINAFGVTIFLFPVKLYDSGISGLSMLLD